MSLLVIQIPPRSRLRSQGPGAATMASNGTEFVYALSPDGLSLTSQGQCAASLLPKADNVVAVLADTDVSWHRITLPKAPAARMRAALSGLLEEAVLDDLDTTHFAVAPEASGGQPTWIAAVNRSWLRAELAALEKANVFVDRIVPSAWPDDPPSGHFAETEGHENGSAQGVALTWSHPDGVACLRLHGGLARAVIRLPAPVGTRWSATPGAAAAAEQWLGTPVNVMPPAQRLLQAARTLWNLRQFDLARRSRGTRALRDTVRRFLSPAWRPVRVGLVALVAAHLIGLNLWAWHQADAITARRQAMVAVLQSAFPNVRAVLDAPLQMQREVQSLRIQAGKPSETDLEPMMQAAATAWPADQPPVDNLRFEPGKLTLAITGWGPPQIEEFRGRMQPAGWQVEASDGRATITRSNLGGSTP
jgi:general secretion pathway protein L